MNSSQPASWRNNVVLPTWVLKARLSAHMVCSKEMVNADTGQTPEFGKEQLTTFRNTSGRDHGAYRKAQQRL